MSEKQSEKQGGKIRVGIGGWTFAPWRGVFYPDTLTQKRELEYASSKLSSIEINGTYYGPQKPETFARWRDEAPDDFVFSLKAPRFSTNLRVLAEAGESIDKFVNGGLAELKHKLGPINWQFMGTKKFDADDFAAFLALLPKSVDGVKLRHVVEVRHDSFNAPDFIAMAREHGVAIVIAGDSDFVQIADVTAPFAYLRIMGSSEKEPLGYSEAMLDKWAARAKALASGKAADGLKTVVTASGDGVARDVYLYFISGHKVHNPAAAMALIERLG